MLKRLLAGFLIIGDSHTVGSFGSQLQNGLAKKFELNTSNSTTTTSSAEVQRFAVAGSAIQHWLKDSFCDNDRSCPFKMGYVVKKDPASNQVLPSQFPNAKKLIQENSDKDLIVALGTNDANIMCRNLRNDNLEKQVAGLLSLRSAKQNCFWVGPVRYDQGPIAKNCGANYDKFVDQLKASVTRQGCTFLDSRQIQLKNKEFLHADAKDQVHFTYSGAKVWADNILDLIISAKADSKVRQNLNSHEFPKSQK